MIPPAKTGNLNNNKKTVTNIDQTNKLKKTNFITFERILKEVDIKFKLPANELTPAAWSLKITESTLKPKWPEVLKGGYKVQEVPDPISINIDTYKKKIEEGRNQKLILFNRGYLISGIKLLIGNKKLPKPPTSVGITIKKIITKAWEVTITLYNWPSLIKLPGKLNSIRINIDKEVPNKPDQKPNKKYKKEISRAETKE